MFLLKLIVFIIWLVILPFLTGLNISLRLPVTRRTVGITWIAGLILSFALFEVVAIPCMLSLQYNAFRTCSIIYAITEVAVAAAGIISCAVISGRAVSRDQQLKTTIRKAFRVIFPGEQQTEAEALLSPRTDPRLIKPVYGRESIFIWFLFLVLLGFQLYMAFTRASFDGDDAFYVVESLLAQQAEVMNTILPYTGVTTKLEFRHAMAVFTMWIGFLARESGIHATIVSHTLLPFVLIPTVYLIYLEIGRILLRDKRESLPVFMVITALLVMFGNTSIYTAETFFMMRTWQGKAMVANFILPLILWIFLWLFEDCRKPGFLWREETGNVRFTRNSAWIMLFLVNMASGVMSSMGIMFGGALVGALGLLLLIYTKDLRVLPKMVLALIPDVIYLALYLLYRG